MPDDNEEGPRSGQGGDQLPLERVLSAPKTPIRAPSEIPLASGGAHPSGTRLVVMVRPAGCRTRMHARWSGTSHSEAEGCSPPRSPRTRTEPAARSTRAPAGRCRDAPLPGLPAALGKGRGMGIRCFARLLSNLGQGCKRWRRRRADSPSRRAPSSHRSREALAHRRHRVDGLTGPTVERPQALSAR
jgi:hypothetical protein